VIAVYNGEDYPDIWFTRIHQYAEMPLNHLGLKVEYYDILSGLPDISSREDVLGVLVWFPKYTVLPDPEGYLDWVESFTKAKKKFVFLGSSGLHSLDKPLPERKIQEFWKWQGLKDEDNWISETYELEFPVLDSTVVGFERNYIDVLHPFKVIKAVDPQIKVHLLARKDGDPSTDSVLVCTGPFGGYISEGYAKYEVFNKTENFRKWYVNPFRFFELAFGLKQYPVPDTTTLFGKRIYYSHIDGDGWNSITELEKYRRNKTICAEVVARELIEAYPDLPVTVSAIAADIDTAWEGKAVSKQVARLLFSLDQVEAASHTYSHPFSWKFFDNFRPEDEIPFLENYLTKTWQGNSYWNKLKRLFGYRERLHGKDVAVQTDAEKVYRPNLPDDTDSEEGAEKILEKYDIPRAFANYPFELDLEIKGSVDKVQSFCPDNKQVMLYQWSGDCQPFEKAVAKSRELGIPNLNGGDSRFDSAFNSYAWVRPLSRNIGDQVQVYASCSNENTYTDLWRGRYFGFKELPETLKNTDSPIRIRPINVYYHMYSGEKLSSLNAVKYNLDYALTQEIIPIETSLFARIVDGFYSCQLVPIDDGGWKVQNRGELQTIRFDRASTQDVDFARSKGVVGAFHLQGSLYVALDPAIEDAVIYLVDEEVEEVPYPVLVESSWRVWNARSRSDEGIEVSCKGYGPCQMEWRVSKDGKWQITMEDEEHQVESVDGVLRFTIGKTAYSENSLTIKSLF